MMILKSFEGAAKAVSKVTRETKLLYSEHYSGQTGNKMYFKPESMQYTGTCKARGVYYKISTLTDEEKARSLITASAGNHAQGMAYAAKPAGIKATIVMLTTTPLIKINRTKGCGAEAALTGDVFDEACTKAYELVDEFDYTFVHPFDDLAVATGRGTVAVEIAKESPTVDYILVPVGGGGLCAGVSTLAKLLNPKIRMIGVRSAGANCTQESLKAGHVVGLPDVNTIADGMAVKCPGEKVFPYIQENVDDIITIEDNELVTTFLDMVENYKMIAEDSDPLTVAALKHMNVEKKKIASALSGGNMDVITMVSIVQHGLTQRDRVFAVPVLLPDKPGELAKASTFLVKGQGNVIKLKHNQFISINRNAAVELRITTGAYGTEHRNAIVQALNGAGYCPKLVKFKGTYTEQDEIIQKTAVVMSKNTQARHH